MNGSVCDKIRVCDANRRKRVENRKKNNRNADEVQL